ncbi:MAG: GntR family transcriptional regulator [Bifidobacteriaceae bacterium]|jgi:GntR family transcriptional regulator|nr:GntR family transcriptional regulator [Bifidobacteriaceae bacterium]
MPSDRPTSTTKHLPQYLAIKDELLRRYVQGKSADSPLPAERALASEFSVTRVTMRRAIDELEADGLVYRVQGGGTFCVGPGVAKSLKLTSFTEDMVARGRRPGSVVLSAEVKPAVQEVASSLGLSPGTAVAEIRRLRTADGEAMCLEVSSWPSSVVPGLERKDLSGSTYRILEKDYGVRLGWAEQVVDAIVLSPDQATLLGVAPFSAALRATRVSFDSRGGRIEHCVTTYRADKYSLRFTVRRQP